MAPDSRAEAATAPASRRRTSGRVVSGVGQALITVGVLVLLLCVYELWITGLSTARDQSRLSRDLARDWARPAPGAAAALALPAASAPIVAAPPALGSALALLYLPRLRGDDGLVVVEGVGVADLQRGPGHLPGSAAPGQIGNMVLSGHRSTYGAPFGDLDDLRTGDPVVVQTRAAWVTYRVDEVQVVAPTDVAVVLPVPRQPGAEPVSARFTLTTCHPRYSARQRLVVSGALVGSSPVTAPRPAVLGG